MNLKNLKIRNVRLFFDDGSNFKDSRENYDAILFAAAPLEIPSYFLDKLNVGGRLVAPIGDAEVQDLSLIKKIGKVTKPNTINVSPKDLKKFLISFY